MSTKKPDVVVIGGGVSGLVAARDLEARGAYVTIVEARGRVGGRTVRTRSQRGATVEGGAQFLKAGHEAAWALVREYGLEVSTAAAEGSDVYLHDGRWSRESSSFADDAGTAAAFSTLRSAFFEIAMSVPTGAMLTHPRAAEFDELTLESWAHAYSSNSSSTARFVRDISFGMGATGGPVSLLAALHYVNAAGGPDSGHEGFLVDGFSGLVDALSDGLRAPIVLDAPVRAIRREGDELALELPSEALRTSQVILAMSPTLIRKIELPEDVSWQPLARWRQECAVKAQVFYESPFWEDWELSGNAAGDRDASYIVNTSHNGIHMLTVLWNSGAHVFTTMDLRRRILDDVHAYFDGAAPLPIDVAITDWSKDPFAGGCGSPLPPGVLSSGDPFAVQLGEAIYRAGTEASSVGWGSVEGAIRAGRRAAEEASLTR